jgi:hypothetical protein
LRFSVGRSGGRGIGRATNAIANGGGERGARADAREHGTRAPGICILARSSIVTMHDASRCLVACSRRLLTSFTNDRRSCCRSSAMRSASAISSNRPPKRYAFLVCMFGVILERFTTNTARATTVTSAIKFREFRSVFSLTSTQLQIKFAAAREDINVLEMVRLLFVRFRFVSLCSFIIVRSIRSIAAYARDDRGRRRSRTQRAADVSPSGEGVHAAVMCRSVRWRRIHVKFFFFFFFFLFLFVLYAKLVVFVLVRRPKQSVIRRRRRRRHRRLAPTHRIELRVRHR